MPFLTDILSDPSVQFGLGLLANNQGRNRREAFGNALQGGLQTYGWGQQLQANQALAGMKALEMRQKMAQQQQLQGLLAGLPEDERAMATLSPEGWAKAKLGQQYPEVPAELRTLEAFGARPDLMQRAIELKRAGASNINLPPNIREGYEYGQDPSGLWSARPIKGGPHDPNAPKPPTENQQKASGFLQRMQEASPMILQSEGDASLKDYYASGTAATNALVSDQYQKYLSAAREWISGALRYESGSAVPEPEFWRYFQTYFRIPGDSDAVVKQKVEARKRMEESLRKYAGPIASPAKPSESGTRPPPPPGFTEPLE